MIKLNLGCGWNQLEGYVNVDYEKSCNPDVVWDLEEFPWPFETDSVTEIVISHVLEHLGREPDVFIKIMKEMYRVCANEALVYIFVPHHRHEDFFGDPTHVRPITVGTLDLFDKVKCQIFIDRKLANTPLGLIHDINFEMISKTVSLDARWHGLLAENKIQRDELDEAIKTYNNVVCRSEFILKAIK